MRNLAGLLALLLAGTALAQTQGQVPRPGETPGSEAARRPAPRGALVDRIVAVVGKEVVTL